MDELNDILRRYFGHSDFRSGQREIIEHILDGRDVLSVMPTGAGKSICYQIPALMTEGITLVISPLISLMSDQVNSLIQNGISAAYINSTLTPAQYETALSRAAEGKYKLIYAAPERLTAPSFVRFARSADIKLIAVDEAHCVSQWGQDFRPSYLNIAEFANTLPSRPITAAFTATATQAVRQDIIKMLRLQDPFCVTTGFDRKNLYFAVLQPEDKLAEVKRLTEEANGAAGIIYCNTRKNVEIVSEYLCSVGIPCTRYHAGLSDTERRKNQEDFLYDRVRVIAATNAFGMGIDKSDVAFVIHFNMPKDLESYYQEAGRAGRDGSEAVCTLLFSRQDIRTNKFLIENSNDEPSDPAAAAALRQRELKRLSVMVGYCTTTGCLRQYILDYFGESGSQNCAKCSNCAAGFSEEDVTVEAQKILSCVFRLHRRGLSMGTRTVAQILHGSAAKRIKQFKLDELSTYGIMKDADMIRIRAITQALLDGGYLAQGQYETIVLTNKAKEILFNGQRFTVRFKGKADTAAKRSFTPYGEDEELFAKLRELRSSFARKAGVPSYIIFGDATLHDMCAKQPRDREEFLTVSGVGKKKADRYGEEFTRVIREHIDNK